MHANNVPCRADQTLLMRRDLATIDISATAVKHFSVDEVGELPEVQHIPQGCGCRIVVVFFKQLVQQKARESCRTTNLPGLLYNQSAGHGCGEEISCSMWTCYLTSSWNLGASIATGDLMMSQVVVKGLQPTQVSREIELLSRMLAELRIWVLA